MEYRLIVGVVGFALALGRFTALEVTRIPRIVLGDVLPPTSGVLPTATLFFVKAHPVMVALAVIGIVSAVALVFGGMMLRRLRCPVDGQGVIVLFRRGINPGPDRVLYCRLRAGSGCADDCIHALGGSRASPGPKVGTQKGGVPHAAG